MREAQKSGLSQQLYVKGKFSFYFILRTRYDIMKSKVEGDYVIGIVCKPSFIRGDFYAGNRIGAEKEQVR